MLKKKKKKKKRIRKIIFKIKQRFKYICFESTIKTIRPMKKTLTLYVGYVQEIVKYPTAKN